MFHGYASLAECYNVDPWFMICKVRLRCLDMLHATYHLWRIPPKFINQDVLILG